MVLDNSIAYVSGYIASWILFLVVTLIIFKMLARWKNCGRFYWGVSKVFLISASLLFFILLMEGYYGFFYDETDSYGYLLTSRRWFKRHYIHNNLALRDDKDYSYKKEDGIRRFVFVGDSFTAGHGIKDIKDRFAGIIEDSLKRYKGNEVYTIAVNGWDTDDEVRYLEKLIESGFEADEIILCFNMNDIAWTSGEHYLVLQSFKEAAPRNWLFTNSFFLNFVYVRSKIFSMPEFMNYFAWLSDSYDDGKKWELEKSQVRRFKEICMKNRISMKVVVLPLIGDISKDFMMRKAHEKMAIFLNEEGIPYIDLSKRLSQYPVKKLMVNKFDAHPNEFAQRIIADEIWKNFFEASSFESNY
ncbi:MAG: SGNH/GDSL hydrolase family protein [Flavobacteriaceae bacterium]|nr:SGNH/GDSL hydrolase family protein [Flavobacteriaceae bacterium]